MTDIYYFGYGSNMSSSKMREWCADAVLIGAAKLRDYRLGFTRQSKRWGAGAADVLPSEGDVVYGALWQISDDDLIALDRKESNGVGYQRFNVTVYVDDKSYEAICYEVIDKHPTDLPTARAYRDLMLEGAHELRLPVEYISMLKALSIVDGDEI